jgi:hypothetical protein
MNKRKSTMFSCLHDSLTNFVYVYREKRKRRRIKRINGEHTLLSF